MRGSAAAPTLLFAPSRTLAPQARKIRGFCHLYDGQEAIALGLQSALTKDDNVISSYRCHALQYIRGDSVKRIVGELFGFELVRFVPTRMSTPALAVPLGPCAPLT